MAIDNPNVNDALQVGLAPYVPPVHPCRVCGYETKAVGAPPEDDRRVCSRRDCRAEHGTVVVLVDGIGQVVPWRSRARTVHDIRALLHIAPDVTLFLVVPDPEGPPPLSPVAARRIAALEMNPNQRDEGPPAHPCPQCGQETKEGSMPGERTCCSRICRKTFGTMRLPLDPPGGISGMGVGSFVLEAGMRFETAPSP